jgi:hypothetical protein
MRLCEAVEGFVRRGLLLLSFGWWELIVDHLPNMCEAARQTYNKIALEEFPGDAHSTQSKRQHTPCMYCRVALF